MRCTIPQTLAIALFLSFLPANAPLAAQNFPQPPDGGLEQIKTMVWGSKNAFTAEEISTMGRLRDASMRDPYALDQLRHLTDNIGPRLSGSPQAQQAVEYVASQMRSLGATVTLEKVSIPHWVRGMETAELVEWPGQTPGTTQKVVLTALGGSGATPASGLTAELIVVDDWESLLAMPKDALKGKILLFNHKFDKELAAEGSGFAAYGGSVMYRAVGPNTGALLGASAVLVRSVGGADFRLPHTGATDFAKGVPPIPAAAVTAEDADLLKNLSRQGSLKLKLTLTPQILPETTSYNVIADWKGSEHPEQVVIVSGHLDSWDLGTGAIDDGAGVAVSMQAIHLLSQLGIHPRRTVRMIAWMSEEPGVIGALQYVNEYKDHMGNHAGAIESDSGADHPTGIAYAGPPGLNEWLLPIAHVLEPIGAGNLASVPEAGSDISTMTEHHVPTFAPAQDSRFYFNYHHTAADTFDKIDPVHLNENAAVMAVLAYALADSAEPAPHGTTH
jgi:Zn-dependent M28 family amino/carboxypeptidase